MCINKRQTSKLSASKVTKKMPVITLGIAAVAVGGGAYYLRKRSKLQDGDEDIEKERNRERKLELERGGSLPTVLKHCLHQHQLFLVNGGTYSYSHHKGELNARVFCCKKCEFYVHPGCAVKAQHGQYPVHADHLLVFREVKSALFCRACGVKCKYWSYWCSICDVNFHEKCREVCLTVNRSEDGIVKDMTGAFKEGLKRGFKEGIKDQIKDDIKDESPEDIVGDVTDVIDTIFSLLF